MLNEYSSRILQKLIENSQEFYQKSRDILIECFDLALTQTSSVFLVTACIAKASDVSDNDYIIDKLNIRQDLIRLRAYQKILLAYVQRCCPNRIEQVYRSVFNAISLDQLLKDRYSTYAVLAIVNKAKASVLERLVRLIKSEQVFTKSPIFLPNLIIGLTTILINGNMNLPMCLDLGQMVTHHMLQPQVLRNKKDKVFYAYIQLLLSQDASSSVVISTIKLIT